MENFARIVSAAQGYAQLGMFNESLRELDALEPELKDRAEVTELRLAVLMQARRWPQALAAARKLCKTQPEVPSGFIHAAYCLHELGRTSEAKSALLVGPALLNEEPSYHYNLACYECALGNTESAEAHLETSFSMDKKYCEFAKTDPDLRPLRGE